MATTIRTEISASNPYYISKHSYLMSRHFALQYPEWQKKKNEIQFRIGSCSVFDGVKNDEKRSSVEASYEKAERYSALMDIVEQSAKIAGGDIWKFVLIGVTTECNYDYLHLIKGMPCCKDVYYKMYRKFFWVLSNKLIAIFTTCLMGQS